MRAARSEPRFIRNVRSHQLVPEVRKNVEAGAQVFTDGFRSYEELGQEFEHKVINHAETYVRGNVHTNGIENFWSLLKRAIKGTHVSVEPFHLFRYLDERTFRFNERKDKDNDRGRFMRAAKNAIASAAPMPCSPGRWSPKRREEPIRPRQRRGGRKKKT